MSDSREFLSGYDKVHEGELSAAEARDGRAEYEASLRERAEEGIREALRGYDLATEVAEENEAKATT